MIFTVLWIAALAAYLAAGAAVSIEATVRMRKLSVAGPFWRPDKEDVFVLAGAGLFWPLVLLAYLWLRGYQWRKQEFEKKEARRGAAGEG